MKTIAALFITLVAASAEANNDVTLDHPVFMCREAFYAEMYQSRLNLSDIDGAVLLAQEGGCQPVPAGVPITIVSTKPKVIGVEVPLYDMRIPGFIPREQFQSR